MIPGQFTGEGVVAAFHGHDLQGRRVLFPKADGARDLIPQQLRSMGAVVIAPVLYRKSSRRVCLTLPVWPWNSTGLMLLSSAPLQPFATWHS